MKKSIFSFFRALLYTFTLRQMIISPIRFWPRSTRWSVNPVKTILSVSKALKFSSAKVAQLIGKRARISPSKLWKRNKNIRAKEMWEQSLNKSKMTASSTFSIPLQFLMIPMLTSTLRLKIYWQLISRLVITSGTESFLGLFSFSQVRLWYFVYWVGFKLFLTLIDNMLQI